MKIKTKKVLVVIATILMVLMMLSNIVNVYAFDPSSIKGDPTMDATEVTTMANKILGALQIIGVAVAVIILAVLGVKYMLGSAEEKAEYKKAFVPYLVGAALVFMAPTIAKAVYNFFQVSTTTKAS